MGVVGEPDGASWGAEDVVADFATDGFTDPGERAALTALRPWVVGRDVLDIGIGGGRTTGLLLPHVRSYVGVDIAPEMLALARDRFPEADLRQGDAADLAGLPDAGHDLVLFSYNGLDSLDHAARARALAAMARVVRPDGRVLFSSLNLDGVSHDERPLRVGGGPGSARFRFHYGQYLRHPGSLLRSVRNYHATRRDALGGGGGDGWDMRALRAHEFRFVVHFATVEETVAEARAAGLEVLAAYADDGRELDPHVAHSDADYVHFVCGRTDQDARHTGSGGR